METMMSRKTATATPKEVTEILALREAGYTVLAISQKFNISVRTVHRHLSTHGAKKGSLKQEVIDNARNDLLKLVTSSPTIREEAAKLIADNLSHTNHVRNIMIEASEHLVATNVHEAAIVMRAAAAYSTALKNTSDTIRSSLGADKVTDDAGEIPELVIRELTNDEVDAITFEGMVGDDV
jgi:predicted transcriptional regulator